MLGLYKKNAVGIAVNDASVRAAELVRGASGVEVRALGSAPLPAGALKNGVIADAGPIKEAITKAMGGAEPGPIVTNEVIFSLSEEVVFTHVFLTKEDEHSARLPKIVREEARKNIPIHEDDIVFTYSAQPRAGAEQGKDDAGNLLEVTIFAAEKHVVNGWRLLFGEAGLRVEDFDIGSLSLLRGLYRKHPVRASCVLSMRERSLEVVVFDREGVAYSFRTKLDARKDASTISMREVRTALDFYKENEERSVEEIVVLSSGEAPRELMNTLQTTFQVGVRQGSVSVDSKLRTTEHVEAIGAALRELEPGWGLDPKIPLDTRVLTPGRAPDTKKLKTLFSGIAGAGGSSIRWKPYTALFLVLLLAVLGARIFVGPVPEDSRPADLRVPDPVASGGTDNGGGEIQEEPDGEVPEGGSAEEDTVTYAEITETPTGWLNVREGPSTDNVIITKVNPGESFPVFDQDGNWVEIELDDGTRGWIYGTYVELVGAP